MKLIHIFILILLMMCCGVFSTLPAVAQATSAPLPTVNTPEKSGYPEKIQALQVELKTLEQQIAEQERTQPDNIKILSADDVNDRVLLQSRVNLDDLRLILEQTDKTISSYNKALSEIQNKRLDLDAKEQWIKNPAQGDLSPEERTLQLNMLDKNRTVLEQDQANLATLLKLLSSKKSIYTQKLNLDQEWVEKLDSVAANYQNEIQQAEQAAALDELEKKQIAREKQVNNLKKQLEDKKLSEFSSYFITEQLRLLQMQVKTDAEDVQLYTTVNTINKLGRLLAREVVGLNELKFALEQSDSSSIDLKNLSDNNTKFYSYITELDKYIADLNNQNMTSSDKLELANLKGLITALSATINTQQETIKSALEYNLNQYDSLKTLHQQVMNNELLAFSSLPTSKAAWQKLSNEITNTPRLLTYQILLSLEELVDKIKNAPLSLFLLIISVEFFILSIGSLIYWYLRKSLKNLKKYGRKKGATASLLNILKMNCFGFTFAIGGISLLFLLKMPQPNFNVLLALTLIHLGVKIPLSIVWQLTMTASKVEDRRPDLFKEMCVVATISWILTIVLVMAYLLSPSETVINALSRCLMCWLLLLQRPLAKLCRYVLLSHWADTDTEKPLTYWIASFTIGIFRIILFSISLVGVIGFVNLSWFILGYFVVVIALIIGWRILLGLLNDLIQWLKDILMMHSRWGMMWSQDVLIPLHRILRLLLFVGLWVSIPQFFMVDRNYSAVSYAISWINQSFFTFGNTSINFTSLLIVSVTLTIVIWLSRWLKQISYRWLFIRISDAGIRHSLSVFLQYFVTLIGIFIILNQLGIDLTTLTVFAGALGVGIGFGLQTIANNFISGILLLIERPLRSGDTVQIRDYIGKIERIGIRSLSMRTFDNMDVIIPNADVISNAFTNWTHSDANLRTILMVGIAYESDPHLAQNLVKNILENHPDILKTPEPMVLIHDFMESSIMLRITYFVDYEKVSQANVRSEVLLSIYDTFKAHDVVQPYPQRDINIKWLDAQHPSQIDQPKPNIISDSV